MWVERLFQDLCGHVMALTDLPAGAPAGFIDREIRSGEGWSERLGEALATCRVFVPLFSPRYFASEMCGKEWYAFAQRAIHHRARSNQSAEAIVPALWVPVPPTQLPGPAERLQFNHRDFGDRYVSDGLYGLIKLKLFEEEYERAVYELAKRIVTVADTIRLGTGRPVDYRLAPSAFGPPDSGVGGPRPMQVTIAAPTRHDLPEGRNAEYYGDSPQDWNPYHPAAARPLAYVAQDWCAPSTTRSPSPPSTRSPGTRRANIPPADRRSCSSTAGPCRTRSGAGGLPPSTPRTAPG